MGELYTADQVTNIIAALRQRHPATDLVGIRAMPQEGGVYALDMPAGLTLAGIDAHDTAAMLAAAKRMLADRIDAAAEAERLRYITGGAGQAMTYQRKADEARACLTATDPMPADYPMLAAEIGITAEDLTGVAQIVNAAYEAWLAVGSQIEAERLGTKAAIDAATTVEEASAAAEAVVWPNS